MLRAFIYVFLSAAALTGCLTQRVICPAYQSAFVFDKTVVKNNFMLYNEDKSKPQEILASNSKTITLPVRDSAWDKSLVVQAPALPIVRRVKKDRYLLLPAKTYKKALKALQTLPMKPVYPKKEEADSNAIKKALDSAARSVTDTLSAKGTKPRENNRGEDSVYVISLAKEKFNVDQDNYMWYFRDILVLPDVRLALKQAEAEGRIKTAKKEGFFSRLKHLFKKKSKEKNLPTPKKDSVTTTSFEDLRDLPDSTGNIRSTKPEQQSVVKKKKGLAGLFRKKEKSSDTLPKKNPDVVEPKKPVKKQEAKKEENDGF
ncbi:MAG: hypothetical protein JST69_06180 [Bacteroidetes bacterium]|nr:hypothetical protein [Bacteroidota bacterium]